MLFFPPLARSLRNVNISGNSLCRKQNNTTSHVLFLVYLQINGSKNCPYIFPSASRSPRDDVQEGVGQVTVTIKGVISTAKRDVAEISAVKGGRRGEDRKRVNISQLINIHLKDTRRKEAEMLLVFDAAERLPCSQNWISAPLW